MTDPIEPILPLSEEIAQEWLAKVSQIYAQSIKDAQDETYSGPDAHPLYPSLVAVTQTKQYLMTLAHSAGSIDQMHFAAAIGSLTIAADHIEAVIVHGAYDFRKTPPARDRDSEPGRPAE